MLNSKRPSQWPRFIPTTLLSLIFAVDLLLTAPVSAQNPSLLPVPPLQWINLTPLIQGANAAQPLKDASIGYDDNGRNLLIFGGESSAGFAQSSTYLLNLDSLSWQTINAPTGLDQVPPARSAAIGGDDSAASYRHGHVVIGGKGTDGNPLSDAWEFDYTNTFWQNITIASGPAPAARWGAVGGLDFRTPFIQDPNLKFPNTSFFMAGGFDGTDGVPLSDVWRLNITGALSSNVINQVEATWEKITLHGNPLPTRVGPAGAMVSQGSQQHIVAVGGCNSTTVTDGCEDATSYVLNVDTLAASDPPGCAAPRVGGSLALNLNQGSPSAFGSQVFLLLGTFNSSLYDDGGGLNLGEVDVFDINAGAWARVLPAGDPGSDGNVTYPTPREGAAVFSWSSALVGGSRSSATDTIVFGGRDASGQYLSEIWLLRAYNAILTESSQHWSGFGDGNLQTGANATGEGVTVGYMTDCATLLRQATPPGSSTTNPSSTSGSNPSQTNVPESNNTPAPVSLYDTSTVHKALAPVSVALFFPAFVLYRLSLPAVTTRNLPSSRGSYLHLGWVVAVTALALGVAGLATAFTSLTYTASLVKRSPPQNLATAHGKAGLALFLGLYGLILLFIFISVLRRHSRERDDSPSRLRKTSNELGEKLGLYTHRGASPAPPSSEFPATIEEPQPRVRSWGSLALGPFSIGHGRRSSDSAIEPAVSPSSTSFEVTNRPNRARHASANNLAAFADPRPSLTPRNLSDMSWLDRRRSLNTTGDLDYALGQMSRREPSTPGTMVLEMRSNRALVNSPPPPDHPVMPCALDSFFHVLLHAFLIALSILSLIALKSRAPIAGFAVFLVWTVCFYLIIITLAWNGIPRESILTVVLHRLRTPPVHPGSSQPSAGLDGVPFPAEGHGPYQHQPMYRTAHDSDYPTSISHGGQTVEGDGDDEDDEARQRRMEEEMSRRDVSIVTVPRRKLFLTNPEPH